MNILSIYEAVCHAFPIDTNKFINYFNRTVDELSSEFDGKYLCGEDTCIIPAEVISDRSNIYDDYKTAVIDNILFFASGDTARKTDFVAHKALAYKKVWRRLHSGKRKTGDVW